MDKWIFYFKCTDSLVLMIFSHFPGIVIVFYIVPINKTNVNKQNSVCFNDNQASYPRYPKGLIGLINLFVLKY